MNANAKAWVAALRSGKYAQGKNLLRTATGRFCCLGVACELAAEAGVIASFTDGGYGIEHENKVLPEQVINWLGLRNDAGYYGGNSLAQMNDSGATFDNIADLIEREPRGLFKKEPK